VSLAAFDLNLLVVLDTVLRERSVARAAAALHVTPSAVSNSLARLRATLDDPLVIRRGRGIVPTPRALELAPMLARTLSTLDHAITHGAFDPATTNRTFTLAIADVGQVVRVPALAAALAREMPHAVLRVVGIASLVALGGLEGLEVDLSIGVAARTRAPGLHYEPLFDEEMTLVARIDHPLAKRALTPKSFGSLRHIAVEMVPGKQFRDPVAVAYAAARVPREVGLIVPTFLSAAAVAAKSDFVTTLPLSLLAALGPGLGVRRLRGPIPPHSLTMHLGYHERTASDPAMVAFRALVRRTLHTTHGTARKS
jgi:DNA-binding transcriptional LysR family regulator